MPAIDSPTAEANRPPLPARIDGVEIEQIHGWFANIYPWKYVLMLSTVFPVRSLWGRPNDYQSVADIAAQNQLLAEYGSGADSDRPFFVAYEHVFGTRLIPDNGAKDMNVRYNREAFKTDYPQSRGEVIHHAERIKEEFGTVYDPIGPFAVFSELIEGAAVIESQCISDTLDKRDRWVGCGTGRLDILNSVFGN